LFETKAGLVQILPDFAAIAKCHLIQCKAVDGKDSTIFAQEGGDDGLELRVQGEYQVGTPQ